MTKGVSIVHFVIKASELVKIIVTIYRVQAYQVPIVNPRWQPKIQDGRHEIHVFDISTSDGADFPPIIEIALFISMFILFLREAKIEDKDNRFQSRKKIYLYKDNQSTTPVVFETGIPRTTDIPSEMSDWYQIGQIRPF